MATQFKMAIEYGISDYLQKNYLISTLISEHYALTFVEHPLGLQADIG